MYFIMLMLALVTSHTLNSYLSFMKFPIPFFCRESDVIVVYCFCKQSHLIRGCPFSFAYHKGCVSSVECHCGLGYIVITCALGDSEVHILTLLVARSFHWGNKFSILLLIWFRK